MGEFATFSVAATPTCKVDTRRARVMRMHEGQAARRELPRRRTWILVVEALGRGVALIARHEGARRL
jgi:hypothetical protein